MTSAAELRGLNATARVLITDDFLSGAAEPDFSDHQVDVDLGRRVPLDALDELITHVVTAGEFSDGVEASDAWLAPRLHAALRLRRSEAADQRLWNWLTVVRHPEYVRWRFPGRAEAVSSKRFIGGDRDNALSRLWWGGELTRNGADYTATVKAFERQDIPSTWFSLDAFHNRAAALAALRMLPSMGARPINRLSTAFNHYLTTIMLDVVAPSSPPDRTAMDEWVTQTPDAFDLLDSELPVGPEEDPVPVEQIDAVEELVRRVAAETGIALDGQ